MSEKQRLIRRMIDMQKQFIARQRRREGSSQPHDPAGEDDGESSEYRGRFEEMATQVVDLAHRERGTSR